MWTPKTPAQHDRRGLRYSHDLTDQEWALVAPLIPPAKLGSNERTVDARKIVNGRMYIVGTGCQWRDIPTDLPPRSTIHDYLDRWDYDGTLGRIHHALYGQCRELAGRETSPTAAVIDSQSVQKRRKRGPSSTRAVMMLARRSKVRSGISPSITGLLMHVMVHAADIQDRDGGAMLMATIFGLYPFLLKLYAHSEVSRSELSDSDESRYGPCARRDRQAVGPCEGTPCAAQTMGRGENLRMALSVSPLGQGLGMSESQSKRLPVARIGAFDASQARQNPWDDLDRLLGSIQWHRGKPTRVVSRGRAAATVPSHTVIGPRFPRVLPTGFETGVQHHPAIDIDCRADNVVGKV
jgi:transposase